jgi:hypothetical protein
MLRRWHIIGTAVLLLALSGAATLSPSRGLTGTFLDGGTARAAQTGNPARTFEELLNLLRVERDVPPGEWRLPSVWKPPAAAHTVPWNQWFKRFRAANLGERLKLESWTCDTAKFLDAFDKIDKSSKAQTVEHAQEENWWVTQRQIRGFVEQAAQLGRSTIVQLVNAAC